MEQITEKLQLLKDKDNIDRKDIDCLFDLLDETLKCCDEIYNYRFNAHLLTVMDMYRVKKISVDVLDHVAKRLGVKYQAAKTKQHRPRQSRHDEQ